MCLTVVGTDCKSTLSGSVQILVGKPDEVNLNEIANTHLETWGYKLKNEYMPDLNIDFKDGKLTGVQQSR